MQITFTFDSQSEVIGFELFELAKKFGYQSSTPMLDRAGVTAITDKIAKSKIIPDELAIGRESAGEITTFKGVGSLSDADEDQDSEDLEEVKQPRKRRTKAEMEAARAAEKQPVKKTAPKPAAKQVKVAEPVDDFTADFGLEEEKPVKSKYTTEGDIIPAFANYAKKHGRDAAVQILKSFFNQGETPSVKAIKPEQFDAAMKALGH